MTAAAPSGVVTFLFTDVEGSTRRWEADAEAMRAALAAHDDALRTAIEAHGGFLFKHTGDGVCAAFASPRSAVDAAVAAQRGLELPVRMGLATGEAELREGDYFGAVLNRAARVMAAGHGGQILLVDSTASLLSGVDLVDLGPRRLRDLPTPVGMFQVRAPGLRTDFPPLRALDTSPGNLRFATSSFIGRESELDEVQAAVKAHRLVTLTGVGGVGKTRLALEVARRLADEFPDGVWVFELAAVTDPAAVPDAVAAVLGITQQAGKSVSESVAAAMEGTIRLLVIDNCEHVREAAADLVEAILAQSVTVKVLATSREGLRLADEQVWLVPSLDVGAGIDSAAVALFVERARGEAAQFSVATPDEAAAVVEICRRLDGIPLAIELAASRMASMTASEVRDRLDQRFRLLVGSRRALERHHTLRHAVAWSFELLDDTEKAAAGAVFGIRRGIRPAQRLRRSRIRRRRRSCRPRSARCIGAQVAAGRRPVSGTYPVFDAGDHPPVRRGTTRRPGPSIRDSGRPLALLRRTGSRHPGPVGQPPPATGLHVVHRRIFQSAHRIPLGCRRRRSRQRRGPRFLRDSRSALWSNSTSPLGGQRNSLNLHAG